MYIGLMLTPVFLLFPFKMKKMRLDIKMMMTFLSINIKVIIKFVNVLWKRFEWSNENGIMHVLIKIIANKYKRLISLHPSSLSCIFQINGW